MAKAKKITKKQYYTSYNILKSDARICLLPINEVNHHLNIVRTARLYNRSFWGLTLDECINAVAGMANIRRCLLLDEYKTRGFMGKYIQTYLFSN